jgi:peptidoglycan/xylan/chitin deacetylase (PgdA/CDA1 family)
MDRELFNRQIAALARRFEIVPLEEAIQGFPTRGARPRVAITFDDAYSGAVSYAPGVLAAHGAPATVFVVPGLLGAEGFWWDAIADPATGAIPVADRERALGPLQGGLEAVRARWEGDGRSWRTPAPDRRPAQLYELEAAVSTQGITLGSHTWSHPNLTKLEGEALREELVRPLRWLEDRFRDRMIPWVTYPYGLASEGTYAAAAETGYSGGFLVEGGAVREAGEARFRLPRVNIPGGLSVEGLMLRVTGVINR